MTLPCTTKAREVSGINGRPCWLCPSSTRRRFVRFPTSRSTASIFVAAREMLALRENSFQIGISRFPEVGVLEGNEPGHFDSFPLFRRPIRLLKRILQATQKFKPLEQASSV